MPVISFVQVGPSPLVWLASNTDGERIKTAPGRPAAEGSFYADLLQNAGANRGNTVGVGSFGFTGFDRIYDTFAVMPSTTYTVSLQHAGGDRFGYVSDTSLITIESVDNVSILRSVSLPTPGLFAWTPVSFQFTTDATTTTAAITLSCLGSINCSALFDDVLICPSQQATETVRLGMPPNPAAFLPGRTSAPIVGATWDPVIDHRTFFPTATVDGIIIALSAANVPTPLGTVLCDLSVPPIVFTGRAGAPFAVPVPSECKLVGVSACAQGVSSDGRTARFANALDIVIGTF